MAGRRPKRRPAPEGKLKELKFDSYAEQQKYLKDSKAAFQHVESLMSSVKAMKEKVENDKDDTKTRIAADIYGYCTEGIEMSLKSLPNYNTRLTFLTKLKLHCEDLIEQLYALNTATQMDEAECLAAEVLIFRKATLEYAKKFQPFNPNRFTKWIKSNLKKFDDLVILVQHYMSEFGFSGPFKNLTNIQKLQVYEGIIRAAGRGHPVVTYTVRALEALGVAVLVFAAGIMVWDIFTAESKVEAVIQVLDTVTELSSVVGRVVEFIGSVLGIV